jgi:hypothetical protein
MEVGSTKDNMEILLLLVVLIEALSKNRESVER